nr:arginine--tRNA ligase, chloroplastic/mitochondrial [Tanacetum cinerariifolium]
MPRYPTFKVEFPTYIQRFWFCVLNRYRLLKTNRLANFTFTFDEMVGEEAPNLVSEKSERGGECEEHALELHLLEFTVALKESCSSLSPHILCEYLYGLSKKFTNYYSSMGEVGSESTLLLCEATTIVMDKCFHILGLTPSDFMTQGLYLWHFRPYRSKDVKARDPPRNSRFELFSIRPNITTDPTFEKGTMFGFIAVSDKYGLLSDGVSHLFEPDFAYVPLFNHEWCHPINMHNGEYIYLGNPSSRHSVAFSSSIEISMEIYVTTEKNAFELYSGKFKLDLLNIWGKNLGNECRCIKVEGEDGFIEMYYMLIKDAVDAAVEIRYKTKRIADEDRDCKVHGQIYAYYGSDILNHCRSSMRPCYWALLFRSDVPFALEGDKIPLRKSVLAVPKGAPLKISAYLYDVISGEVILDGICELDSLTEGSSKGDIQGLEGTECSLSLKVNWTYQA